MNVLHYNGWKIAFEVVSDVIAVFAIYNSDGAFVESDVYRGQREICFFERQVCRAMGLPH